MKLPAISAMPITQWINNLPLVNKLMWSFGSIITLMVVIVATNHYASIKIANIGYYISDVLIPTAEAENELKNNINASASIIRNYIIFGDKKYKNQLQQIWANIYTNLETIDKSIHHFDQRSIDLLQTAKDRVNSLRESEERIVKIAHTIDANPATKILLKEANPKAKRVLKAITAFINEEKMLEATEERKEILALLADSRGSFTMSMTSIRSYLFSGDILWRLEFEKHWEKNREKYSLLKDKFHLFNNYQKILFSKYNRNIKGFLQLSDRMFKIRGSKKWDMAHFMLTTDFDPKLANALSTIKDLTSEITDTIAKKNSYMDEQRIWMATVSVILTIIAVIIGIFLTFLISNRVSRSIDTISKVINNIVAGNLNNDIVAESKDEIGTLLASIGEMQNKLQKIIEVETQTIINSAREGDLSKRINTLDKEGCYKNLGEGINELLEINSQIIEDTVNIFHSLSHGDLNNSISNDYQGDFYRIKRDANSTIEKLHQVISIEIQDIIESALHGNLSKRIAIDDKKGFFLDISKQVNQLVEVNQKIINDTLKVFEAMSKGDLSKSISTSYQGDFAKLKNDANSTICKLNNVIEKDIQNMVNTALQGDLSQRIQLDNKQGFFRVLSQSINQLAEICESVILDASTAVGEMEKGNLTKTMEGTYLGSFNTLKNNINNTINHLHRVISEIQDSSELVKAASIEMSTGALELSNRTEEQASVLEETAASMNEMTDSLKESAKSMNTASEMTVKTEEYAVAGGSAVDSVVEAMENINIAGGQISAITGVIDEISFQTNLLALNAAVEAARAGEQGRGFAVVAGEVRVLAQRSSDAAKEIKELINNSVEQVDNGSKLVNGSGEALKEIINSVKQVNSTINSLSMTADEQQEGIQQVNIAVTNMEQMTQQNASLAEESSATSQSMLEQAEKLNQMIIFFNLGDK